MAFNNTIAFEVDAATGNSVNGGGFDNTSGTPGTNYAWGAGQTVISYTDLATVGVSAIVTSVGRAFIAADVGNVLNITSGTNFTSGRYQIASVSAGAATLDRNCTTGVGASGNAKLGGSLATIQQGINAAFISAGAVESCAVWVKKGAYTSTLALTTSGSVGTANFNFRILGYNSSHNDNPTPQSGNQPTFAVGSGAGVNGLDESSSCGYRIGYITFLGAVTSGTAGVIGINSTSAYITVFACKVSGFSSHGMKGTGQQTMFAMSEAVSNGGVGIYCTNYGKIICNWSHKNTSHGIQMDSTVAGCVGNLVTNNGARGIDLGDPYGANCSGNTIYGSGTDGIRLGPNSYDLVLGNICFNNIIAKSGGWGITNAGIVPSNQTTVGTLDYNAYYSNTAGNLQNGVALNTHDVAISINPFNSSDANLASETSPDWGLNNTASAGASLRAAGFPGNFADLTTTTGYKDIGAVQHQDSGGGGTTIIQTWIMGG